MGDYADDAIEYALSEHLYYIDNLIDDGDLDGFVSTCKRKPADTPTKVARMAAHRSFDRIWQEDYMSRQNAYHWLACKLKINNRRAHMQHMNITQCERVIKVCDEFLGRTVAQDDFAGIED